ncbi:hypothetical protein BURPS406E_D0942 [Burkholderia pseudomallei 406e]|uniref:Uncharacterized protein n=1 Tax=Burkholderia pseudomallei 1710a TaxID=320371 RepID=A0A0E1VWK3_BURPE|nr:hypothetical protein BURPS406E_D0942 [Burkholderia pseudomallei 406e]EEC31768.1 conserved hypothetical protein [Burkholderia pseudomallei 576]EET04534.1 hypothetical protein BURPS1710A_A1269 [Burkholderia pseudomallei 1710a]
MTGLAHSVGPPGRASGALPVTGRSRFASRSRAPMERHRQ